MMTSAAATEGGGMKTVPTGHMYRQMFEAEVQLVNSLANSKATRREKRQDKDALSSSTEIHYEGEFPVVRNAFPTMLNERQRTWATSLPNDWQIENPVLKRYKTLEVRKKEKENVKYLDEDDVAGLPDLVVPVSQDVNSAGRQRTLELVNRLTEGRRERHQAALEDVDLDISNDGKTFDEEMEKRSQETSFFLERQQDEINRIMSTLDDNEAVKNFDNKRLEKIWSAVEQICKYRQDSVSKLGVDLREIETRRRRSTFDILRSYFKVFERIAHLLPVDVRTMMETKCQTLNDILIENEVRLSEFYGLMVKHEFELERSLRESWTEKRNYWRSIKQDVLLEKFSLYMNSPSVTSPERASEILESLNREQEMINEARRELVASFKENFLPPKSHKSSVYQWNTAMGQFSKQLLAVQEKYMSLLHSEYEKICQECLGELETHKKSLLAAEICDEKTVIDSMEKMFLPLVGKRQKMFEHILEDMDTSLEKQNKEQFEEIKSLFKFCQGLAHVWDQHEAGLAQQERTMQENLDANRNRNDAINQEREANLDLTIDKLRQETSEAGLKATLKQVMDILDRIKTGYEDFSVQQEKIVKKYPIGVHQEYDKYDQNLLKFFGISRKNPEEKKKKASDSTGAGSGNAKSRSKDAGSVSERTGKDSQSSMDGAKDTNRSTKSSSREASEIEFGEPVPVPSETRVLRPFPMVATNGTLAPLKPSTGAESSKAGSESMQKIKKTVKEILQLSSGAKFFVLSVAGADGVIESSDNQETKPKSNKKVDPEGDGIELTEEEISLSLGQEDPETTTEGDLIVTVEKEELSRDYLTTYDLPNTYFQEIKKEMRRNFLEHLEKWKVESDQRATSIVSAKTNELKNELQLKKHLHAPRAKRAEVDIHNVRAAELVMHSDRVERHIKGITQTLNDLRKEFVDMSLKHDKLHEDFKVAIHTLEGVFANATKSQKLQEIQAQLKKEKDGFMEKIRSDLRAFRQKMDDTSQMLREANSRFIKGFKVFSEGGNFCVEEIEQYKGTLDRISGQIEQTEGVIMADLENMESSRMDRVNQVCSTFEGKFKHHMADLTFIEKLSRWLTNTQVKIKTEASESNTQSQTLALLNKKIGRKIDAIENPTPEKEKLSAIELQEWLLTVFDTFNARAEYLNCIKVPVNQSQTTGTSGQPGKVGFSEAGKKSHEESAMRLMKSIFNAQKTKLAMNQDGPDGGKASVRGDGPGAGLGGGGAFGGDEKSRHTMSRRSTALSESNSASGSKQRVSSGGQPAGGGTRRGSKGIKFDKKYLVFGERPVEGSHFLANIHRILQYSLEGMLVASDSYYRNKGLRAITRPQTIQDNFDNCADMIANKLQNYQTQAEEFYNNTLQEFRQQIRELESKVSQTPQLVLKQFYEERVATLRDTKPIPELILKCGQLANRRSEFEAKLHPDIGHPNRVQQLAQLDSEEQERHKEIVETIDLCSSGVNELLQRQATSFCSDLAKLSEQLLLQYDNLLLIEDVNMSNFGNKQMSTEELIRRKAQGLPLEEPVEHPAVPRGRGNWDGIPLNALSSKETLDPELEIVKSPVISTLKSSNAHKMVDSSKDRYYEMFVQEFQKKKDKSAKSFEHERMQETRWTENWARSVQKVKALY